MRHTSGPVRLLHPFGSTLVLFCFGSTVALRILLVTLTYRLSASGSSAAISRPTPDAIINPSSSMAPASVDSTVGRHYGCGLGPTWHCLLQAPPVSVWSARALLVSSLAPPSIISTLDPVCWRMTYCPLPEGRSSCTGGGRYVMLMDCLCVFFCLIWFSFVPFITPR